jgi:hypothetical protein
MRLVRIGCFVAVLALSACGISAGQKLTPDQPTSTTGASTTQTKKWQGLIVTDNPYMISSERLEQMNKGGFGAY